MGHVIPQAFDWLIPEQLGASANPSVSSPAAEALVSHHIDLLINLHEIPDAPELGVASIHLPVPSSEPPSPAQLDYGVSVIRAALAAGRRVVVHCGAGLGRTGTLLAAYLVTLGYEPQAAIDRVRSVRPGSVETLEQEQAVYTFAAAMEDACT